MNGPWISEGRCSVLLLDAPGQSQQYYEVEYRRAEPGQASGYYLHGSQFYGQLLMASTAAMARYEAFALIASRCPWPSETFYAIADRATRAAVSSRPVEP